MKKLKLNLGTIKEMLSKEQMKMVVGGYDYGGYGEGGCAWCICEDPGGSSSPCYYTHDAEAMCRRYYPNCEYLITSTLPGCGGCIMN